MLMSARRILTNATEAQIVLTQLGRTTAPVSLVLLEMADKIATVNILTIGQGNATF